MSIAWRKLLNAYLRPTRCVKSNKAFQQIVLSVYFTLAIEVRGAPHEELEVLGSQFSEHEGRVIATDQNFEHFLLGISRLASTMTASFVSSPCTSCAVSSHCTYSLEKPTRLLIVHRSKSDQVTSLTQCSRTQELVLLLRLREIFSGSQIKRSLCLPRVLEQLPADSGEVLKLQAVTSFGDVHAASETAMIAPLSSSSKPDNFLHQVFTSTCPCCRLCRCCRTQIAFWSGALAASDTSTTL